MEKKDIQLMVSSDKKYMIARATLPSDFRGTATPINREGYNMVQYKGNRAIPIKNGNNMDNDLPIYWIFEGNQYLVDVPWGFQVANEDLIFAVNGIFRVTIGVSGRELCSEAVQYWERVEDKDQNGVVFEYLRDHFLDSDQNHSGLSIYFRDIYLSEIKSKLKSEIDKSKKTLSKELIDGSMERILANPCIADTGDWRVDLLREYHVNNCNGGKRDEYEQ
jgi:hypothetical protein